MTKTVAILLGLAVVWLAAWSIAAYSCYESGSDQLATAEELRTPTTVLEPGADVRVEGTLVSAPTVNALYSGRPCLAAQTNLWARSRYKDSQDHWGYASALIKERRVGPENIEIAVGDQRLQLPLDRWVAHELTSEDVKEIPAVLSVTQQEIDAVTKKMPGDFTGYAVSEGTIDGGTHVFVIGRLEDGGGALRLEKHRGLGRVEIFVGTQEEYVRDLVRKGNASRVLAWVFGPIGLPPIIVLGVVLLVRARKRDASKQAA